MNCHAARRRLLGAPRPEQPPADVRGHLAYCSECWAWHKDLVFLERHVPRIPVPRCRTRKKDAFLKSFLAAGATPEPPPQFVFQPSPAPIPFIKKVNQGPEGPWFKQPHWLAGLAAAVFLGIGWLMSR
jgi:hypothetical protein